MGTRCSLPNSSRGGGTHSVARIHNFSVVILAAFQFLKYGCKVHGVVYNCEHLRGPEMRHVERCTKRYRPFVLQQRENDTAASKCRLVNDTTPFHNARQLVQFVSEDIFCVVGLETSLGSCLSRFRNDQIYRLVDLIFKWLECKY